MSPTNLESKSHVPCQHLLPTSSHHLTWTRGWLVGGLEWDYFYGGWTTLVLICIHCFFSCHICNFLKAFRQNEEPLLLLGWTRNLNTAWFVGTKVTQSSKSRKKTNARKMFKNIGITVGELSRIWCNRHVERMDKCQFHISCESENLKVRDHFEYTRGEGRIILKRILETRLSTRFGKGSCAWVLWKWTLTFGFLKGETSLTS
jgi:hypothetical protein